MSRRLSWLPRLREIRKSVGNSVRSHYDRRDLQDLFMLQPRAAQNLLEILPTVKVGRALLVERDALGRFLEEIYEAGDAAAERMVRREMKGKTSRKKTRSLVRRDFDRVEASSLAAWVKRGHLEIRFDTAQQLFDALWRVAAGVQEDLDEFIRLYEPEKPVVQSDSMADLAMLYAELEQLEQAKRPSVGQKMPGKLRNLDASQMAS